MSETIKEKTKQLKKSTIDKSKEIKEGMKKFNDKFMDKAKNLKTEFAPSPAKPCSLKSVKKSSVNSKKKSSKK